jgi:hypothetical protein
VFIAFSMQAGKQQVALPINRTDAGWIGADAKIDVGDPPRWQAHAEVRACRRPLPSVLFAAELDPGCVERFVPLGNVAERRPNIRGRVDRPLIVTIARSRKT